VRRARNGHLKPDTIQLDHPAYRFHSTGKHGRHDLLNLEVPPNGFEHSRALRVVSQPSERRIFAAFGGGSESKRCGFFHSKIRGEPEVVLV
jgi:hypothetical protein